jgi:predicted nucleotidyltransferase
VKFGLDDKTIERMQTVLVRYPEVDKAVLYGSRAKGNYKMGSDIDLTLYGSGLTLTILHKIENELDDLLLPYKIDLSIFEQIADPAVIDHIRRVGVVFYEKCVRF